jgi:hypothetical protein
MMDRTEPMLTVDVMDLLRLRLPLLLLVDVAFPGSLPMLTDEALAPA